MDAGYPPTRTVGIVLYPDFEALDVFGPVEAFVTARFLGTDYLKPDPRPFHVIFVAETLDPIACYCGPRAVPDHTFDSCPPLDVVLVPGGFGSSAAAGNQAILRFLKTCVEDPKVAVVASVCTGAEVLASAGVLDGLPAATNHQAFDMVSRGAPRVLWDNVSRWVDAGKLVTSAGVSAGIDMALYLVARLAGRTVAENAAATMEYDWRRTP
ncbi:MAG TPA: DJ-1/PfpI family protein [Kofleriaceae bacterium]|nr:DJ-1/PfpI family protein [Kofleriaceae bacterium]